MEISTVLVKGLNYQLE